MYFDSNDEFVLEDSIPELLEAQIDTPITEYEDPTVYSDALLDRICNKYHNVVVFFGSEELQTQGTTKITRTIFAGTQDRKENALVFLENLNKVKKTKKKFSTGKRPLTKDAFDLNASFDTSN